MRAQQLISWLQLRSLCAARSACRAPLGAAQSGCAQPRDCSSRRNRLGCPASEGRRICGRAPGTSAKYSAHARGVTGLERPTIEGFTCQALDALGDSWTCL